MKIKIDNQEFNVVGHAEVRRIVTLSLRKTGFKSFVLLKNGKPVELNQLALKDGDEFIIIEKQD